MTSGRASDVQVTGGLPPDALDGTGTGQDVRVLVASWDRNVPGETAPEHFGPTWTVLGLGVPA